MAAHRITTNRVHGALAMVVLAALVAGCGAILDIGKPGDTAHVRITGTAPGTLQMIRTNNFTQLLNTQTGDISLNIITADTLDITLPYEENYGLAGRLRFYMQLTNMDPAEAELRIRVDIEGVEPYDVEATLTTLPHEYTFLAF